jgi:hypothetical protein
VPTITTPMIEANPDTAVMLDDQGTFDTLTAETQSALHPALETLRQILDRPDLHTIGDLAALTEQLTGEMMLFNALVGGPLAQLSAASAPADDVGIDFLAEFLRELES